MNLYKNNVQVLNAYFYSVVLIRIYTSVIHASINFSFELKHLSVNEFEAFNILQLWRNGLEPIVQVKLEKPTPKKLEVPDINKRKTVSGQMIELTE